MFRREGGLAAVEFALVFPIFFLLFYGLVMWAFILILQESMTFAAQSGARAALAARYEDVPPATHLATATTLARDSVGRALDWMPPDWKDNVLGTDNGKVEVQVQNDGADWWIEVTVRYANFGAAPALPQITVPGGARFPPVPNQLVGQAVLRL
jgi:Flp pilus assembly protein TadG